MLSKKRVIILGLLLITIVIAAIVLLRPKEDEAPVKTKVEQGETITTDEIAQKTPSPTTQATPTNTDFYNTITQSGGVAPDSNGQSTFGIVKVQNPLAGWYVVTIKKGSLEPAKVVFYQTDNSHNPLTIVAGPGTYFPRERFSFPDEVWSALK